MENRDVTVLLKRASAGDAAAQSELAPLVYGALHSRAEAMMRGESRAQSIQATVLVNDAFMKLAGASVEWESRAHFFRLAARTMRRILVDHARARVSEKRGGEFTKVQLDESLTVSATEGADVLALNEALERLAEVDPQQAEIVTLRFFGGMSMQGVAETLGISKRAAEREWTMIKAWLRKEMSD
jgi:RNA polymerase sigma-70 factor, ECF subfamily